MIRNYSDHAANERTYLAWVRTGIAVIAFGFVIERFNLFLLTVANAATGDSTHPVPFQRLPGPFSRYEGLAFICGGIGLVILATTRFLRATRMIDESESHPAGNVRTELILSAALVVLVAIYSIYLAFA
jgi:putative membrane protein